MIISASRRTDIPAFYTPWLLNRLQAGFLRLSNPFNPAQVRKVSLEARDVDLIVFWSKNPAPLLPHLRELENRGYPSYLHYTLTGYPPLCEPGPPPLETGLAIFRDLSRLCGVGRVIWRYDPIILNRTFTVAYHTEQFARIAAGLKGYCRRVYLSFFDFYRKAVLRLNGIPELAPLEIRARAEELDKLLRQLASIAAEYDLGLFSCAESMDLRGYNIMHGKCIDDLLIEQEFGLCFPSRKDPGQRKDCGCIKSIDIGTYNTCPHGCLYCYANKDHAQAKKNYAAHNPAGESMLSENRGPA